MIAGKSCVIFLVHRAQPPSAIFATLANRAPTRPLAVRAGIVPPAHNLRNSFYPVQLGFVDFAGNDYLISLSIRLSGNQGQGFGGSHHLMLAIVVSYPYRIFIGNAEINRGDAAFSSALQLAQPLMRDVEVSRHRHGKNPMRTGRFLSGPGNTIAENP